MLFQVIAYIGSDVRVIFNDQDMHGMDTLLCRPKEKAQADDNNTWLGPVLPRLP
jgi:hypothetical protein